MDKEYTVTELVKITGVKRCEINEAIRAGELKARQDKSYSGKAYFVTLEDWQIYKDAWTEKRRIFRDLCARIDCDRNWTTIRELCELYPEYSYRMIHYAVRQTRERTGLAEKLSNVWHVRVDALLQYVSGRAYD